MAFSIQSDVGGWLDDGEMTTFHAFLGCSLDGYIAGPNGELDWLTVFDNTGYDDFFGTVSTHSPWAAPPTT